MRISTLLSTSLASQDAAALHDQLLRYAQDLQQLMWQYASLENRHQKMLLALGRRECGDDLLLDTMRQSTALYLVTNPEGEITFISPALERTRPKKGRPLKGQSVRQLAPPDGHADMAALLSHLSKQDTTNNAIWHARLGLPVVKTDIRLFQALIVYADNAGLPQLYWFLADAVQSNSRTLDIQKCFEFFDASDAGLFITNAAGDIGAVNPAFTQITNFSEQDALGCNPRILGSGLHDAAFFNAFWQRLCGEGCWHGELFNRRKSGQVFLMAMTARMIRKADGETTGYIAAFDDKTVREADMRQSDHGAFHDALTGLPNRRLLNKRMSMAMTDASNQHRKLFVLLFELDQLNAINDELGQNIGDLVQQEVSVRLQSAVRRTDTVARIGAGVFVALLGSVDNQGDAEKISNAIQFSMSVRVHAGMHRMDVKFSMGGACYPTDGDDIASILTNAQVAMADARRAGRTVDFYQPRQAS